MCTESGINGSGLIFVAEQLTHFLSLLLKCNLCGRFLFKELRSLWRRLLFGNCGIIKGIIKNTAFFSRQTFMPVNGIYILD